MSHRATRTGRAPSPTPTWDGDGMISLAEGQPSYGPVVLPLEPFPVATEEENPGQPPWPPLLTREGRAVGEARPIRGRSSSGLLVQPVSIE